MSINDQYYIRGKVTPDNRKISVIHGMNKIVEISVLSEDKIKRVGD